MPAPRSAASLRLRLPFQTLAFSDTQRECSRFRTRALRHPCTDWALSRSPARRGVGRRLRTIDPSTRNATISTVLCSRSRVGTAPRRRRQNRQRRCLRRQQSRRLGSRQPRRGRGRAASPVLRMFNIGFVGHVIVMSIFVFYPSIGVLHGFSCQVLATLEEPTASGRLRRTSGRTDERAS